jgi:hypothetical protein
MLLGTPKKLLSGELAAQQPTTRASPMIYGGLFGA